MSTKQNKDPGLKALDRLLAMATKEESKALIPVLRRIIRENANKLENCPMCSSPISDTITTYTKETAEDVIKILYGWSIDHGRHEFKSSEIKHLLDHTQYANLNHLIGFKGIIYRPMNLKTRRPYTSGHYGIHRGRAEEFFRGERKGPIQIRRNRFTHERIEEVEGAIGEHPHVTDLLDAEGNYKQPTLV